MAGSFNQWAKCVLRWAFYIYVVVLSAASLPPIRAVWDDIFQPPNAQLLIVTPVRLHDVTVVYDGRVIKQRPGSFIRVVAGYGAYPDMRTRKFEPMIQVSWVGPDGPRSVSRTMRQVDSGPECLYVLRLDAAGVPIAPDQRTELAPFWWNCFSR